MPTKVEDLEELDKEGKLVSGSSKTITKRDSGDTVIVKKADSGEKKASKDYSKRKWMWPLLVVILVLLNTALLFSYMFEGFCFATVLMAFAMFGIPYLVKVRKAKPLLVWGTIILLITGVCVSFVWTETVFKQYGPYENKLSNSGTVLTKGTVTPYSGDTSSSFSFTVKLTGLVVNNTTVRLIIHGNTQHSGFISYDDPDDAFFSGGYAKFYVMTSTDNVNYKVTVSNLEEDIYNYGFNASEVNGNTYHNYTTYKGSNSSGWGLGPVTDSYTSVMIYTMEISMFSVFVMVGLLYYVIVAMFWWTQRAKQQREKFLDEVEKEEETAGPETKKATFTCSSCGADVSADDAECPKCGEKFDDASEKKVDKPVTEKDESDKGDVKEKDADLTDKEIKKDEKDLDANKPKKNW